MSAPQEPMQLDPSAVLEELLQIPEARALWELAQERTARKLLQAQLAEAGRRVAELENAQAPTTPPERPIVGDRAVSEGAYMPSLDSDRHPTIPGQDDSPVQVPS